MSKNFIYGSKEKEKESLFCFYIVKKFSPREAAIKAGYDWKSSEHTAAALLLNSQIQKRIEKMSGEETAKKLKQEVIAGLQRLAFGSVNDCIKLMDIENLESESAEALDLFGISEIKRQKQGVFEIKFFDRLKALEALAGLCADMPGKTMDLIAALEKSVPDAASEEATDEN